MCTCTDMCLSIQFVLVLNRLDSMPTSVLCRCYCQVSMWIEFALVVVQAKITGTRSIVQLLEPQACGAG